MDVSNAIFYRCLAQPLVKNFVQRVAGQCLNFNSSVDNFTPEKLNPLRKAFSVNV